MAYGLYLYKEFKSKSDKTIRLEIFQKDYSGASIEIDSLSATPVILSIDNSNKEVYSPIVKTNLAINIIDTNQFDYSIFFTPDATKFKVIVKVAGVEEWLGYLTPDSYIEQEAYRTEINLLARDNIGMLSSMPFDITTNVATIRSVINAAMTKIGFLSTLEYRVNKLDNSEVNIIDGVISPDLFADSDWYESLEQILLGIGAQLRYVGANKYAIFSIGDLSSYGTTLSTQTFMFIEQSGVSEIVPAWRTIEIEQDFAFKESIYTGAIPDADYVFFEVRNAGLLADRLYRPLPPVGTQVDTPRSFYKVPAGVNWTCQIPMLLPSDYGKNANTFLITGGGINPFVGGALNYYLDLPQTRANSLVQVKFKVKRTIQGVTKAARISDDYVLKEIALSTSQPLHFRCNFFYDDGEDIEYLSSVGWYLKPEVYAETFDIVLDQIGDEENFATAYQDIEFNLGYIRQSGRLNMVIYPYYLENPLGIDVNNFVLEIKDFDIEMTIPSGNIGGIITGATINADHNQSGNISLTIGQVPFYQGNNLSMLGGIYENVAYYPPMYNYHRLGGDNYKLYELIGREIAHHYKTQKRKLSGVIINSDTFTSMPSFGKLFTDGTNTYALNYGSLDYASEQMQVELIEVEPYEYEEYTFVEAEVESGADSMGSGEREYVQWSSAGNAKRIYELDTASEADQGGSYVMIDKSGLESAKKVDIFALLAQKENLLPATPSDPESKFLNGNKEWSLINLGSGGNSPKVFFTSIASDVATYKELSYEPEAITSYCETILTGEEILCDEFLYPIGVGVELLDSGTWEFDFFGKVSATAGSVMMRVEVFKRTTGGVESVLFSKESDIINNTDYEYIKFIYTSPSIAVDSTDRIGVKVYGSSTIAAAITLTWAIGDGDASFFVTPLAMRHAQLRGKNDEEGFQHITQGNQTFEGIKTFSGAFTDMVENRNTRLRLPKLAPTSATADEYYLYATDSGFSGELPSGSGSVTSIALTMPTGFSVSGSPITESGTFGVTFASGYFLPTTTQFATKLDVSLKGTPNGLAELDENGFVKNTQLPSYVDDVLEYGYFSELPATGTSGKIYVITNPLDTDHYNKTYRWSGTIYTEISQSLALGETSSTAYRGDRGKIAYDHSQLITGNPHAVTAAQVGALPITGGDITGENLALNSSRQGGWSYGYKIKHSGNQYGYFGLFGDNDIADYAFLTINGDFNNSSALRIYPSAIQWGDGVIYHEGNSNLDSVNWSAAKLTSTTLLLPQSAPSLSSGEMAIYGLESGFSGELPSGAGSVTSIALTVPTGLRVKKDAGGTFAQTATITESGEFIVEITSGYTLPTSSQVADFTTAFTNRITSLTTTGSGAATLVANVLNIPTYSLPTATDEILGGVKIGSNITITDGVISVAAPYSLPTASASVLGGVKIGSGVTITDGVISVSTDYAATNHNHDLTYLGINAKAADSDKLDGNDSTYFATASQLNAANLSNGYLPYWNGSSLANSAITNDTDRLNIIGKSIKLYSLQYADNDYRYIGTEYNNGNGNNRAEIRFAIDGGDTQTRITLHTANGDGQINEVMRANRLGNVDIGYGGTRSEKLAVNGTTYFNGASTVVGNLTATENIFTNLRIPKVAPTSPTSGEYYFYIVE